MVWQKTYKRLYSIVHMVHMLSSIKVLPITLYFNCNFYLEQNHSLPECRTNSVKYFLQSFTALPCRIPSCGYDKRHISAYTASSKWYICGPASKLPIT